MSDCENEENEYNRSKEAQEKALKEYLIKEPLQNKLVILFYEAMKSNLNYFDPDLIASVSSSIVDELVLTKKIDDKNLVRSKIWNLKDRENPFLCEKVYNGIITPKKYVEMSNDEMKSEEIKLIDEKAAQDSLFDAQFAKLEAETDIFRCGKCKQRKTTYQQLQTRGADEPMTTFVTCVVCKNRWKF
ncbi:transcription elongation factor TFIIS [Gurleya vavrai]